MTKQAPHLRLVESSARFRVGQIVRHRLFGYRGVIYDVDPDFRGSDEWYEAMARSRPRRDKPWYHVLPHDMAHTTYVAERNLEEDADAAPIEHPLLGELFDGRGEAGDYKPARRAN